MIIKYIENENEFIKMSSMRASSIEQNECIKQMYETNELAWQDILIMIDQDGKVLARCVQMEDRLGFLTIENMAFIDACTFISYMQKHTHSETLNFHLYSDKCNHDLLMSALLKCGFEVHHEKESYVQIPCVSNIEFVFKNGHEVTREQFISMFKQVAPLHKDRGFQEDYLQLGVSQASEKHFREIIDEKDDPSFRLVMYKHNKPIGFVVVRALMKENTGIGYNAGIGYIGVLCEHRGNGYGKDLLELASTLCAKHHFNHLIADVDVQNTPMIKHLLDVGYTLSCTEKVFSWKRF